MNRLRLLTAVLLTPACLFVRADKVRILEDPRDAEQARMDLVQQAKHAIDAQYYIVGNDTFTLASLTLLRDATRRGCTVRVIIDGSSNKLSGPMHAHLRNEGVQIKIFHPMSLAKPSWIFKRMHDKGLNVDGRRMIRGGRNIEGDYYGYARRNFVDRDVYVEGHSARESSTYFDELWSSREVVPVKISAAAAARADEARQILDAARVRLKMQKRPKWNSGRDWSAGAREVAHVEFLHDPVGLKDRAPGIAQALRARLREAHRSVVVETPYLVPTKELLIDLNDIRQRGVNRIELITNSVRSNDVLLPQIGYEAAKRELQKRGAELWEFKGPDTLHAKSAVLDDHLALIGSFNVDPRSQHLNTETAVAIDDAVVARELTRYINAHKQQCIHVSANGRVVETGAAPLPLATRVKMSVLKLLMPLFRSQL